jgi:hypothetical protein
LAYFSEQSMGDTSEIGIAHGFRRLFFRLLDRRLS